MARLSQALLAAGIALGFVGTAQAQSEADFADARCMVAIADMMDNPAPGDPPVTDESSWMAESFVMYYLGRIRGRNPALPLDGLLLPDVIRAAKENRTAEIKRCFAQMQGVGEDLGQFGRAANAVPGGAGK